MLNSFTRIHTSTLINILINLLKLIKRKAKISLLIGSIRLFHRDNFPGHLIFLISGNYQDNRNIVNKVLK